ncbi:DUF192 domain-containing protein [Altericroceibacterium spongiae]|uniref:DUF192 domain-containing protein n=1 Tax=Altericroceibacterium spongiae TaxID=2320269 RepID=A0A420EIU3_9SPHN|nr:DUF192 domain-containing protein [Altericroceibacterium spongiae]RKF20625.1 DUF192 domain-containing protein [Altericroceibacterium spongiae]
MTRISTVLVPIALALAACSQQAIGKPPASSEGTLSRHPESGLEVIPVTIDSDSNSHTFQAEVAATPREQARGLMFRTEMGADEGMIFLRKFAQPASFWMKNTVIPLDIIYIGADHRILNIAANAKPYSTEPLLSEGPALAILELNGGRAAELGIEPGDEVSW